jgi:TRAP-type mannitol/chloroaromatic compound transport system permease small subunit
MTGLAHTLDRAVALLGHLGAALILLAIAVSVAEIFQRYVLGAPTIWGTDLVIAVAAVTYILSGPYAFLHGRHIQITVFSDRFPPRASWLARFLGLLAGLLYVSALLYGAVEMAEDSIRTGERSGQAWDVPTPQIVKVILVCGLALLLLQILRSLLALLANLQRR